jgi:pSer/pThr/pTyr-binding forkhead associated (FHA) protein
MMVPRITIEQVGTGKRWSFDKAEIRLGRNHTCEVSVPGDDYPMVGREHARIRCEGGKMWVEDLNSTNGTLVNAEKIARKELLNGDVLRLGSDGPDFRLEIGTSGVPSPAEMPPTVVSSPSGMRREPADLMPTQLSSVTSARGEPMSTIPSSQPVVPETRSPKELSAAEESVIEQKLNVLRNLVIVLVILVLILGGVALGEIQQMSRNREEIRGLRSDLYGTAAKYKPQITQQMDDLSKRLDAMETSIDGMDGKMRQAEDQMVQRLDNRIPVILDRYVKDKLKQAQQQAAHAIP